jgi:hypothetical protein
MICGSEKRGGKTQEELRQLVAEVQRRQCELDNMEVKAARGMCGREG